MVYKYTFIASEKKIFLIPNEVYPSGNRDME
uniref:Unclassified n=1 Tax=Fusarium pseudograminearum CS3487 TaxID=1318458 RepID=W1I974_FUSPS|nr:unclassified [Fusarium pseudograminearum CS3487]CDX48331.1 unclassified [Fusarium pseudograminearum CS3487]